MRVGDPTEVLADWLSERRSLLLITHERPDGDAIGSLFGLSAALEAGGHRCFCFLSEGVPSRYLPLLPPGAVAATTPLRDFATLDGVICLDVANEGRADLPDGVTVDGLTCPVANIDHHADNTGFGDIVWVDERCAATAQMLTAFLREKGYDIPAPAAECLLIGLIMDTGGFRFQNTGPDVLRDAAFLLESGADLHGAMDALFFRRPYRHKLFEGELMRDATFACDGRLLYAVLDPVLMAESGLSGGDSEGLIDALRAVDGVDIACLLQPEEGAVRFSLRSRSPAWSVRRIAAALGGGGHVLAAGARTEGMSLDQARDVLVELVGKVLCG